MTFSTEVKTTPSGHCKRRHYNSQLGDNLSWTFHDSSILHLMGWNKHDQYFIYIFSQLFDLKESLIASLSSENGVRFGSINFRVSVWVVCLNESNKKWFNDSFASLKQNGSQKSMCGIFNVLKCFSKNIQKFSDIKTSIKQGHIELIRNDSTEFI